MFLGPILVHSSITPSTCRSAVGVRATHLLQEQSPPSVTVVGRGGSPFVRRRPSLSVSDFSVVWGPSVPTQPPPPLSIRRVGSVEEPDGDGGGHPGFTGRSVVFLGQEGRDSMHRGDLRTLRPWTSHLRLPNPVDVGGSPSALREVGRGPGLGSSVYLFRSFPRLASTPESPPPRMCRWREDRGWEP